MREKISKYILVAILLCVMVLILTGCSSKENPTNENVQSNNEDINENDLKNNNKQEELEAGEYILKYGTYKGTESQYTDNGMINAELSITINPDGTYDLKSSNTSVVENSNGTYKLEKYDGIYKDYILNFSSGFFYIISDNNTLETPAGSGAKFIYENVENIDNTENNISGKGLQVGDYFVTYGIYELKQGNDKTEIEIYTDKIIVKHTGNEDDEFTYKIEEYNYSDSPNIDPNIHKGIVVYQSNTNYGGFYPVDNNKLAARKGNNNFYTLKRAFSDEELESILKSDEAKTYIVLKDYKLRNGSYVTLPTIETLAISSTSGKYRISNETGTFSINENQINLENGLVLNVISDNKFTCNGKTYTLDKEY